jgi:hypothetical protein
MGRSIAAYVATNIHARAYAPFWPDPEYVLDPVGVEADDQVGGLVDDHAAVADLHAERVDVEDRVDLVDGPVSSTL